MNAAGRRATGGRLLVVSRDLDGGPSLLAAGDRSRVSKAAKGSQSVAAAPPLSRKPCEYPLSFRLDAVCGDSVYRFVRSLWTPLASQGQSVSRGAALEKKKSGTLLTDVLIARS
jgi:hypothetical protein